MRTAHKNCIWFDQCGSECGEGCEDYSPADETEMNEAFYRNILAENAQEYQKVVRDYADGGDGSES